MRVLFCTGGSPHSRRAIRYAAQLLQARGGEATLLCIAEHPNDEACAAAFEAARPMLEGISVRTMVREGQPAEEILCVLEEERYDLVVVGEKGHHTPMTRFLLGPTADRVANHASVPVLVVKGHPEAPVTPIRRILVAVSLHDADRSARLMRWIRPLAQSLDAEVTVLHVMSQLPIPPTGTPDDWEASAEELVEEHTKEGEMLERDLAVLREQDGAVAARALVRHGMVVDEVLDEIEQGGYDLVILGGHERGSWLKELILENVALHILHRAGQPVLTIHSAPSG